MERGAVKLSHTQSHEARKRALPVQFICLETVDSTNKEVGRRFQDNRLTQDAWLLAQTQTAGQGRRGRPWQGRAGNFYGTRLLPFGGHDSATRGRHGHPAVIEEISRLTFATALSVADAIRACGIAPDDVMLKWPNDVLIAGAKVAGILLELFTAPHGQALAIGIGVNLTTAPRLPDRQVTCLADHGLPPGELSPLGFCHALEDAFAPWQAASAAKVVAAWSQRAHPKGTPLTVNGPEGAVAGEYCGLDSDGALLLTTQDGIMRFLVGDVVLAGG